MAVEPAARRPFIISQTGLRRMLARSRNELSARAASGRPSRRWKTREEERERARAATMEVEGEKERAGKSVAWYGLKDKGERANGEIKSIEKSERTYVR